MKKFFGLCCVLLALGCEKAALRIGVTSGPHAMIAEKVKELAAKDGLKVDVVEFNDFILPNAALNEGDLDLNSYQHQPFLDNQVKTKGYNLVTVAKTVLMPLGIYSNTLKSLDELKEKAKVAIPNDPTNGGRALLLLQQVGLIKLKNQSSPTLLDVSENLKQLQIIELEAPQLPRTLADVDAAIINTDWIVLSGMDPASALITEDKNSPYVNVIVAKADRKSDEAIQKIVNIYHSNEIKDYITSQFKGAVIPAW